MSLVNYIICDYPRCNIKEKVLVSCSVGQHHTTPLKMNWIMKDVRHFCSQSHADNMPRPNNRQRRARRSQIRKSAPLRTKVECPEDNCYDGKVNDGFQPEVDCTLCQATGFVYVKERK